MRRRATEAVVLLLHLQRRNDSRRTRAITIASSTPSRRSFAAGNERLAGDIETLESALHTLRADRMALAERFDHLNRTGACAPGSPAAAARIRRAGQVGRRCARDAATYCPTLVSTTGSSCGLPPFALLEERRLIEHCQAGLLDPY